MAMTLCALCAAVPAAVFCANDDAALCGPCDASFHANPLTARHQRRPLAPAAPAASAGSAPSDSADDVAVVPQCGPPAPAPRAPAPASTAGAASTMFDDFFGAAAAFIDDPAEDAYPAPADFLSGDLADGEDPLMCFRFDGVVPQHGGADLFTTAPPAPTAPAAAYYNPFIKPAAPAAAAPHPMLVPQLEAGEPAARAPLYLDLDDSEEEGAGGAGGRAPLAGPPAPRYLEDDDEEEYDDDEERAFRRVARRAPLSLATRARRGVDPAALPALGEPEVQLTREQRVQRYKEKRARRNFRKTIRYQSRKAYAEIRPRIKGRFVSPEEYAAYTAGGHDAVVPAF
jgi:hypothetical protein